jgi:hypothetical protein
MSIFGSIQPSSEFDLFGIAGKINSPTRTVTTHFFQTKASADGFSSNWELLKMLKPLRDNTRLDQINSIDDLLQRDVSDSRVSKGLIQYIRQDISGSNNPIILPSIVVVLLPKDIFSTGSQQYPKAFIDSQPQKYNNLFGLQTVFKNDLGNKLWSVLDIYDNQPGSSTQIGVSKLTINTENVIPHILDGQHRMMAYKYLAGKVSFPSLEDSIYKSFYNQNDQIENWQSDLPVTLIWFTSTSEEELDVKEYTRSMFLDINQTSQNITVSRKILLNETDPKGVLTRAFYNHIGEKYGNQFTSNISLANSGFDMSVDISELNKSKYNLAGKWMPTSIFVPELFAYTLDWLLFGQQSINDLGVKSIQDKKERRNKSRFEDFFGTGMFSRFIEERENIDSETTMFVYSEEGSKAIFEEQFIRKIGSRLYEFINKFGITKAYVEAAKNLDYYIENDREYLGLQPSGPTEEMYTRISTVWKKVYLGGEGLYYNIKQFTKGSHYSNYLTFIDEKFFLEIAKYFQETDPQIVKIKKFDNNFKTVAFFTGLVMSFDHLIRSNDSNQVDDFLEELDSMDKGTWEKFINMIQDLKSSECELQYIKNIDPKSWIKYRAIILHFLKLNSNKIEIYNSENIRELVCLERLIYKDQLEYYLTNEINNIGGAQARQIKNDIKSGTFAIFPKTKYIELQNKSKKITQDFLSKYFDEIYDHYNLNINE